MAKIKITAHITAEAFSLAHAAVDAMDRKLREHGGITHGATISPDDTQAMTHDQGRAWSPPPSYDDCEAAGLDGTARDGEHSWEDVARAALAKLEQYAADDDFERVMRAMQPCEELGGPEGAQYVSLMERIANEANDRARRMREQMEPREWTIQFSRGEGGCIGVTQTVVARNREEVEAIVRGRIRSGEIDLAHAVKITDGGLP